MTPALHGAASVDMPDKKAYSGSMQAQTEKDCTIGVRHNRWPSIIFLCGISAVALIVCPLYLIFYGIRPGTVLLFLGMCVSTVTAITAGYHRLYAHSAYRANAFYRFLMLAFGAATFQQSALKWASLHRTHHQYTDTERDPYNIKKGFFYAHVGWILFYLRSIDFSNVKDLEKSKLIMNQHRHFQLWAIGFGVVMPVIIGALYGQVLEALLFGVAARMFVIFQVTFFINSFAHSYGVDTFGGGTSARDNWIGAILTGGEGYHSFHHRFPADYRNGVLWHHWDPSKWFIWTAGRLGWAWDLKRTPPSRILEARLFPA